MYIKRMDAIVSTLLLLFSVSALATPHNSEQKLGAKLFSDINLSVERNQSCESCHALSKIKVPTEGSNGRSTMKNQPAIGSVDPENVKNGTSVSNGSRARQFGDLNAPSVGYAGFSPEFHFDETIFGGGRFVGGQFWNGRASNLVEQAKGPFLNPGEMAMPSEWSVIERLQESKTYRWLFWKAYRMDIKYINEDDPEVAVAYQAMAEAIAAFEKTSRFNRFDSKFDFVHEGITSYTDSELRGEALFNGQGACSTCHTTTGIEGEGTPALLANFHHNNLGVPANPQIPGDPEANTGVAGNPNIDDARGEPSLPQDVEGRHKAVSLRNVELTAPYMHNGVLKTLEAVVHFYNTRDVLDECTAPSDATNPEFGITCWPVPEFSAGMTRGIVGDLGLTEQDEADIVAYMKTFTDNYPKWGNSNGKRDRNVSKHARSPFRGYLPQ